MISVALFPDLDGHWFSVLEDDPRAMAMYLRHYSSEKARGKRQPTPLYGNAAKFVGPGASIVLMTPGSDALFVWRKQEYRKDGQSGVECSIFRNESAVLSSDLIREADEIAWQRWPGERHFTFVWDSKVKSANPGYCFKRAGWRTCGRNADGRLTILEVLPPPIELDVRAAACRSGVLVAGPTRRAQAGTRTTTAHAAGAERQTIAADGGRSYPPAFVGGTNKEARQG